MSDVCSAILTEVNTLEDQLTALSAPDVILPDKPKKIQALKTAIALKQAEFQNCRKLHPVIQYTVTVAPEVHAFQTLRDANGNLYPAAGEAQSTVIPPGKKAQCPHGRILITNDQILQRASVPPIAEVAPVTGMILGRDLGAPDGTVIKAGFDSIPASATPHMFCTNDHDLVCLPNGDVLLITAAASRTPIDPKPIWFDSAYRGEYGPGARAVVLVWKSTDGGSTFKYQSEFDPARLEDGTGAFPQPAGATTHPGTPDHPTFDMGGCDGQQAFVDPVTGYIYVAFQCGGNTQDTSVKSHFQISGSGLWKTLVVVSLDSGVSWSSLGYLPAYAWRTKVLRAPDGTLVINQWNQLSFCQQNGLGSYNLDKPKSFLQNLTNEWPDGPNNPKKTSASPYILANSMGHPILIKSPDSQSPMLVSPATTGGVYGYSIYLYQASTGTFVQVGKPILAEVPSAGNFVMQLVAIDLGVGPVLLYWYDFNVSTKRATVRGRLIYGDQDHSNDFAISKAGGLERSWDYTQFGAFWYGDYHTAGGFQSKGISGTSYNFYPMWVEPDSTVRYTSIIVTVRTGIPGGGEIGGGV